MKAGWTDQSWARDPISAAQKVSLHEPSQRPNLPARTLSRGRPPEKCFSSTETLVLWTEVKFGQSAGLGSVGLTMKMELRLRAGLTC